MTAPFDDAARTGLTECRDRKELGARPNRQSSGSPRLTRPITAALSLNIQPAAGHTFWRIWSRRLARLPCNEGGDDRRNNYHGPRQRRLR